MWSGEVIKRGVWHFWRPRILTITHFSVLVCKATGKKRQKLILRRHIIDIHTSDFAENPLAFTLIVTGVGRLYFKALCLPDRDAIVMFLKPEQVHKESISHPQAVSLERFVREKLGKRTLLIQRIVLRRYARLLHSGFVGMRDSESGSQMGETGTSSLAATRTDLFPFN